MNLVKLAPKAALSTRPPSRISQATNKFSRPEFIANSSIRGFSSKKSDEGLSRGGMPEKPLRVHYEEPAHKYPSTGFLDSIRRVLNAPPSGLIQVLNRAHVKSLDIMKGGEQAFKVISELLSSRVSAKDLPAEEELKRVMTSSMVEKFSEYKKVQSRGHRDFYSRIDKLLHIELLRCSQPDSKFTWVDLLFTMSLEKIDPEEKLTPVRDAVWRFRYCSDEQWRLSRVIFPDLFSKSDDNDDEDED